MKKILFGLLAVSLLFAGASSAVAQSGTDFDFDQRTASTCKVNGQEVPCGDIGQAVGFGIGLIVFFLVIGIVTFVFWLWMLVHAATNPIENKALWIIIMVITGLIGSIIYYFMVKRGNGNQPVPNPASSYTPPSPPSPPTPPVS